MCKLQKGIWGFKQSARMWNEKVNKVLTREAFSISKADPCLYSRKQDRWIYIPIYIDDIITCFEQEADYNQIVYKLKEYFEIKKLGNISYYLRIQTERTWKLSSQKISEILELFHMQDAKEVKTMEPGYLKSNEICYPTICIAEQSISCYMLPL